nr:unnamed protein product [Rangifer tarandus platyrhynchus]
MSRGWGRERAPALLPEDPRLRSRSGGRASSRAPETNASARAQSRPSSRRPAPRVSVPAPRTPYSQGASLCASYLCLGILTLSVPRVLDTQRPVHPAPGHPLFSVPVPGNPHTQVARA